jgi:hypothetical protein
VRYFDDEIFHIELAKLRQLVPGVKTGETVALE